MISCFNGKIKVTSIQGYRDLFGKKEYHDGIDIVGITDKTVYAINDGIVTVLNEPNGFGNYCRIKTADNQYNFYYAHMSEIVVKTGQKIKKGDVLGVMGSTGKSTGEHTHICIRNVRTGKDIDIHRYTQIPKKCCVYNSTPVYTPYEAACIVERLCEFDKKLIKWLWTYPDANNMFVKMCYQMLY